MSSELNSFQHSISIIKILSRDTKKIHQQTDFDGKINFTTGTQSQILLSDIDSIPIFSFNWNISIA